jgi:hypothetical protein
MNSKKKMVEIMSIPDGYDLIEKGGNIIRAERQLDLCHTNFTELDIALAKKWKRNHVHRHYERDYTCISEYLSDETIKFILSEAQDNIKKELNKLRQDE